MQLLIEEMDIEKSFDKIAVELLTQKALIVNTEIVRFTEIEFYYYHEDHHQDCYTHEHCRAAGEWRFHSQGLDITFESSDKSDGGILIRGILVGSEYINGPRKSISKIFELFGKASTPTTITLGNAELRNMPVLKTFRNLPNAVTYADFHFRRYRYLVELENLAIAPAKKLAIRAGHTVVSK